MATKLPRSLNITLSVLSVIGIILWTIGAFFGLYFFSCGSLGLAVPIAFGSGLLLALFIWLTRRYTGYVAEAYRRKEAARFRMIYLAAYIAVVLGSGWLVMHAVAVSTTIKTEYRDSAVKDLAGLYNLVDNRAPAGSYAEYVNEQLQRYREGNYQKETSTLEFECSQLEQKLTKSSGYAALQREITDYWQYADKTVRDWDMWYLPSTAFTFHSRMNEWRSALEKCSSYR